MTSEHVTIFEMAPRDGLQNEKRPIATADKIALIDRLSRCGFTKIEATSFVSPKWVPQMADAADVMDGITRAPGIDYAVLTPNLRGLEGAKAGRADEIAIFAAASESFSKANLNASIADALERFAAVAKASLEAEIPVRGYVSVVTDCPYDGPVAPETAARVAESLFAMGCYEVSLGDTIGHATPESTDAMLKAVLNVAPANRFAGHFHDTKGRALENIGVSLEHGIRTFDSCVGGLGGCPYAPGAKGNVATEAVIPFVEERGYTTGADRDAVNEAAAFAKALTSPQ